MIPDAISVVSYIAATSCCLLLALLCVARASISARQATDAQLAYTDHILLVCSLLCIRYILHRAVARTLYTVHAIFDQTSTA
jgi:hypothetical protein